MWDFRDFGWSHVCCLPKTTRCNSSLLTLANVEQRRNWITCLFWTLEVCSLKATLNLLLSGLNLCAHCVEWLTQWIRFGLPQLGEAHCYTGAGIQTAETSGIETALKIQPSLVNIPRHVEVLRVNQCLGSIQFVKSMTSAVSNNLYCRK